MLDNIRFGLEGEKYTYWHVAMDTDVCDVGTKAKEIFDLDTDKVDYVEFMKEKVVSDEDIDKFIKFYEETKSDKSNKKIQLNCFDKDGTLRKTLLSHIVLETPNEQYNGIIGLLNYVD